MAHPLKLIGLGLWLAAAAVSAVFSIPELFATATVVAFVVWLAWSPIGAFRFARRELPRSARWMWLGINAVVVESAPAVMRLEMMIIALVAVNLSIWASYALIGLPSRVRRWLLSSARRLSAWTEA